MKTMRVICTWRTEAEVEVPDDFKDTGNLSEVPADVLEEMNSANAELVDWEFRG